MGVEEGMNTARQGCSRERQGSEVVGNVGRKSFTGR